MTEENKTFGEFIRQKREEKGITLRKFAEMVGISPTFISKLERGEFKPPKEENIKRIADILNLNFDDLMALAGKVSSDLVNIIRQNPQKIAGMLRRTANVDSSNQWEEKK